MAESIVYRNLNDSVKEVSDANPFPVRTVWGNEVTKTVAFDGTSGNGAIGTVALFTITGEVMYRLVAYCTEDLAGATATISVGTTGNTAVNIAVTTATNIDSGEIWYNATPVVGTATVTETNLPYFLNVNGNDIFATIATANITDGTVVFKLYYTPLNSSSTVVAA